MKLEPIGMPLIMNIIECNDFDTFEEIFSNHSLSDDALKLGYLMALKIKNEKIASSIYLRRPEIFRISFIDNDTFEKLIGENILSMYPLDKKLTDKSYDEIIQILFPQSFVSSIRKRLGMKIKQHGTVIINNLFYLKSLVSLDNNIDLVLSLDHSKILKNSHDIFSNYPTSWLLENYSLKKVFHFLSVTQDQEFFEDIFRMVRTLSQNGMSHREFKEMIGNDLFLPLSLHQKLIERITDLEYIKCDMNLNQNLLYLDGQKIFEYVISVPKTAKDLILTGRVLKHCVGSYIEEVIRKSTQIINLKLDGELKYTLEIRFIGTKAKIVQFKGRYNSNEMEKLEGEKYRQEILRILNQK